MVSRLVVILFSVPKVRGGFTIVVLMCLGRRVCYLVIMCLFCKTCLAQNCSVEEMLELKQGEDVLEKVEKFCYLGYMIRFMVDPLT